MKYYEYDIKKLNEMLKNNKITSEELFNYSNKLAHISQELYNPFVTIIDDYKTISSNSLLNGIPYALKDNMSTKGILTTASSNSLKNYVPIFDSTVYYKLKNSGAVLVGKTVLDEFAMGGEGITGHTGIVKNPWDISRIIGGSSCGSAASVALGIVPFAIGSDTGDSIRKPAAYAGVVGFKPSYGRISRYGLFAFASSLDHVGVLTRSVSDAAIVTDIIKGRDEKDMTSLKDDDIKYTDTLDNSIKGKRFFYIKEAIEKDSSLFLNTLDKIKTLGIIIEEVSIEKDLLKALYPSYMCISCAEATSNYSNLTGIHFGTRETGNTHTEIMEKYRTNNFSELIKRRFVLGSYVLRKENQEKLFKNACRVRRLIVDKINDLFKKYDALIMPASSHIAPKFGECFDRLSDEYLILENHLVIGNFGGYPSITIPSDFVNNMPVGINITGPYKSDAQVLNYAYKIEEILGLKGIVCGGSENV